MAVAAVTAGGVAVAAVVITGVNAAGGDRAVVVEVVDGDTFDARIGDRTERIRMLNIDTPETKDPALPVQCLGPEATAELSSFLPVGTPVTLEYDDVRTDRYGRTLAGVFLEDRTLVNAEIARAGLAAAVIVDGNDRFYPPVEDARAEAAARGLGLHSEYIPCTVPARVATLTAAAATTPSPPADSAEQLDAGADALKALVTGAEELATDISMSSPGTAALTPEVHDSFLDLVDSLHDDLQRDVTTKRAKAQQLRDAEARAAAEAQRIEEQEQARLEQEQEREQERVAEERRRADEAAAERSRRESVRRVPAEPAPSRSSGSGGDDGYTGRRCYEPGGETYRPC